MNKSIKAKQKPKDIDAEREPKEPETCGQVLDFNINLCDTNLIYFCICSFEIPMTRRPLKIDPPSLFHYPRIVPKFPQSQPFVAKCPHPGLTGLDTAAPPNYRVLPLTISKLEAPEEIWSGKTTWKWSGAKAETAKPQKLQEFLKATISLSVISSAIFY